MRNLLNFLGRYNNLIIFLILEGIALYMVVTRNNYQNTRVLKNIRVLTIGIEKKVSNTKSYLNLNEINAKIARENVALRNEIEKTVRNDSQLFSSVSDSSHKQHYLFTNAEIVNNSVNRQKNFFTLNKGKKQGVNVDMAVACSDGVVGIIISSSENFSVGMSLLNLDFRLSTRMKSNNFFGSLSWDGRDYRYAILNEIPQHVTVNKGDTIETTGYSAIFPEGIMVGVVNDYEKVGGDFYKIRVLLSTDFRRLNYVNVIANLERTEQIELEQPYQ